jgi:hypothetical protein
MTEDDPQRGIPVDTVVSFIDPVTQLPVKGKVQRENSHFIGVGYERKTKMRDGTIEAARLYINISKMNVFVVR